MKEIKNKKAYFDYEILEEEVAGMMLNTPMVKAINAGVFAITGNYVKIVGDDVFLIGEQGDSSIKLLLTKNQLNRFTGKVRERGLTIIPLEVIKSRGKYKLRIGLAKGKKDFDKRATDKKRDIDIDVKRVVKSQKFGEY